MRGFPRAATLSAAAFLFLAAGGLAGPAIAQQANPSPAVFIPTHDGESLTSETPRFAGASGPAANGDGAGSQIPVVTHAIAPLPAQDLLDQQPDDEAAGRH